MCLLRSWGKGRHVCPNILATAVGFRVECQVECVKAPRFKACTYSFELQSKLLKGGYIGDYTGNYYRGY